MAETRRMRCAGLAARMENITISYRISVEKPEGKRSLEIPRSECEDNIKMDLREIGCVGINWIDLSQDSDQ
jgi:hypothetical protein